MAERGRKRKKVRIIPVGGLDRIGQNMTLIECEDQILVVDKGRIVQCGTHDELMRREGIYRHFITEREKAVGWKI